MLQDIPQTHIQLSTDFPCTKMLWVVKCMVIVTAMFNDVEKRHMLTDKIFESPLQLMLQLQVIEREK